MTTFSKLAMSLVRNSDKRLFEQGEGGGGVIRSADDRFPEGKYVEVTMVNFVEW